jgi:MFS family permease
MFLIIATGCTLIISGVSGPWLAFAAILIGLGMGAETDLLTYTVSRYFPPRALSRALGAVWIFFAWGSAAGVFAGSLSYDYTGSYATALWLYFGCALCSAAVTLFLGAYRYQGHGPEDELGIPVPSAAE